MSTNSALSSVKFIENWLETVPLDIEVVGQPSYNAGTNSTTLELKELLHIRPNAVFVRIEGVVNPLKVTGVTGNSIVIPGEHIEAEKVTVAPPYFINGTPMRVNSEIEGINLDVKYPMNYLYAVMREKDRAITSTIRREADIRLFILDESEPGETTAEHYTNVINGLEAYYQRLLDHLQTDSKSFVEPQEIEVIKYNHVDWGHFRSDKGYTKSVFNDNVSGIELQFTVPISRCCHFC